MGVPIGDPPRREVDPVVPHQPAGLDGHRSGEQLVAGLGVEQLPDEGRSVVEFVDDGVLRTVVRSGQ
jgi:hypothetical protein